MRSNRGFNGKLSGKWRGGETPPYYLSLITSSVGVKILSINSW